MDDTLKSNEHPNNFKCKTYWNYVDGEGIRLEEPEQRTAQYEIDVKDEGYGKKLCVKIFSRIGSDPSHKRDFYTYLEVPIDCTFTRALADTICSNLDVIRT